ncbi:MAG: hypothetical protein KJZ87_12120 [Thermoguttaceae bacterium]|nr:hypothetical protein [Thermoguttaceae bacterium]
MPWLSWKPRDATATNLSGDTSAPYPNGAVPPLRLSPLDFAEGYPLPVEVPTMLPIGPAPYLRPSAGLQDGHEAFVVVAADNRSTRIFMATSATVEEPEQVKRGVKNHVRKEGWSQQRYEWSRLAARWTLSTRFRASPRSAAWRRC